MKKLKLGKTVFADAKVLSKAELKKVMGGGNVENSSACPTGMYECYCNGIFRGCVFGQNQCYFTCTS